MPDRSSYDYAIIRVVPRVEREEFINVGVILSCPDQKYLDAQVDLDTHRLKTLDPTADAEAIKAHLEAILAVCRGGDGAGPIGRLSQRERFHWLVAARSTVIQTSPVHTGLCSEPAKALERLMKAMVRPTSASTQAGMDG